MCAQVGPCGATIGPHLMHTHSHASLPPLPSFTNGHHIQFDTFVDYAECWICDSSIFDFGGPILIIIDPWDLKFDSAHAPIEALSKSIEMMG